MIQVNILRDRNEVVKGIDINGHAGYAEYGQDVICAAVSAPVSYTHLDVYKRQHLCMG